MRHSTKAWVLRVALALTAVVLLQLLLLKFTGAWIAFDSTFLNALFTVLAGSAIPVTAWVVLEDLPWRGLRTGGRTIIGLCLPIWFLLLLVPAYRHHTWDTVAEVKTGDSRYRAYLRTYRFNQTAIELRKETSIAPGLLLVTGPTVGTADTARLDIQPDGNVLARVNLPLSHRTWTYTFAGP